MNASKAVNGLDKVVEFIQAAKIPNGSKTARMIDEIRNAQTVIEEQDERIAIMQESDSLGGLFLELLEKYAERAGRVLELCDTESLDTAEKKLALSDEIQQYLKRAADCGISTVPVYEIRKGHGRMAVERDENGFVALWFVTEEYKEPGVTANEIPVNAAPVFGLRLRDAKHAEIVAKSFAWISDKIAEQTEGAKE